MKYQRPEKSRTSRSVGLPLFMASAIMAERSGISKLGRIWDASLPKSLRKLLKAAGVADLD